MKSKLCLHPVFFLAVFILFNSAIAQSPGFQWAKSIGGANNQIAYAIAVDAIGNVYTSGYFCGTADFDPGTGIFNLVSDGVADAFISKIDSSGNFVWAKNVGGAGSDQATSIAVDSSGNVFITGGFPFTADFDPDNGTYNLGSAGDFDVFVLKLDASGNFVWARGFGGTSLDMGTSLKADALGNVYVAGSFGGTADFDPGIGIFNLTAISEDAFILKLDANGIFVWAKNMGGSPAAFAQSIELDPSGNIYTLGAFMGTADFYPGAGSYSLAAAGDIDIFISKLDAAGNFIWAKNIGGISQDIAYSMALDASGNIYATGGFSGTADFDPNAGTSNLTAAGDMDIFVLKLNPLGDYVWVKRVGGNSDEIARSLAIDPSNNIYVTGRFTGNADFDPSAGTMSITSSGIEDLFILKLDANGNFAWVKNSGGTFAYTEGWAIAIDASYNIYTAGGFFGTVNFNSGPSITELSSSPGSYDVFVHKMSQASDITEVNEYSRSGIDNRIYPNPCNNEFHIVIPEPAYGTSIELYDCLSQLVCKQAAIGGPNTMLLQDCAAGVYCVKVLKDGKIISTQKLVKPKAN